MEEAERPTEPALERSPITERVLSWLGPPRLVWTTLWAGIALVSPIVFSTAIVRLTDRPFGTDDLIQLVLTQAGLAFACFVLLIGVGVLARQASVARTDLARLAPDDVPADLFAAIGNVPGPLLLTVVVVSITSANGLATYGPPPPLAALPFLFAYMVPIMTFVWVYVTVLVELDRLGRHPLPLDVFPQDRTLGLERLGSLASTGLGLLLFASIPVLLAAADEPVTLGIALVIVAAAVGFFVLSMWRLHRQMAAAKSRYIATTRQLYADAYAPLREHPDLETLDARSSLLGAAQALHDRAEALPSWPIDEGTLRFTVVVITGVVTSLVVRGLFAAVGF